MEDGDAGCAEGEGAPTQLYKSWGLPLGNQSFDIVEGGVDAVAGKVEEHVGKMLLRVGATVWSMRAQTDKQSSDGKGHGVSLINGAPPAAGGNAATLRAIYSSDGESGYTMLFSKAVYDWRGKQAKGTRWKDRPPYMAMSLSDRGQKSIVVGENGVQGFSVGFVFVQTHGPDPPMEVNLLSDEFAQLVWFPHDANGSKKVAVCKKELGGEFYLLSPSQIVPFNSDDTCTFMLNALSTEQGEEMLNLTRIEKSAFSADYRQLFAASVGQDDACTTLFDLAACGVKLNTLENGRAMLEIHQVKHHFFKTTTAASFETPIPEVLNVFRWICAGRPQKGGCADWVASKTLAAEEMAQRQAEAKKGGRGLRRAAAKGPASGPAAEAATTAAASGPAAAAAAAAATAAGTAAAAAASAVAAQTEEENEQEAAAAKLKAKEAKAAEAAQKEQAKVDEAVARGKELPKLMKLPKVKEPVQPSEKEGRDLLGLMTRTAEKLPGMESPWLEQAQAVLFGCLRDAVKAGFMISRDKGANAIKKAFDALEKFKLDGFDCMLHEIRTTGFVFCLNTRVRISPRTR